MTVDDENLESDGELAAQLAAEYALARIDRPDLTSDNWLREHPGIDGLAALVNQVDAAFSQALLASPVLTMPFDLGPFHLRRLLGVGSFAAVYLADDRIHSREVAVKIFTPGHSLAADEQSQFFHDRRMASQVQHPAVVQLYDSGTIAGWRYIVMELGHHGTLRDELQRQPSPWVESRAAWFVAKLAEAVAAAHDAGIIHRDIKPSNILLDAEGGPKLTDFGLARDTRDVQEVFDGSLVCGFPPFVAPEIRANGIATASVRSDLYSLGVILHLLLEGRLPLEASDRMPASDDSSLAPPKCQSLIAWDLRRIVDRALSAEPAQRFTSARDLADELKRFLARRPLLLFPSSWMYRCRLWMFREPIQAGLALSLALLLMAAGWLTLNQWERGRERHLRAQLERENDEFRQQVADEAERAILAEVAVTWRQLTPSRRAAVKRRLGDALATRERLSAGEMSANRQLQVRSLFAQSLSMHDFEVRKRWDLPYDVFTTWWSARHPQTNVLVIGIPDNLLPLDDRETLSHMDPTLPRWIPKYGPVGRWLIALKPAGGWDVRVGDRPREAVGTWPETSSVTLAVHFAADESKLFTVDSTGAIMRHRLPSSDLDRVECPSDPDHQWTAAAWSPIGDRVALGSEDGWVVLWHRTTDQWQVDWRRQVATGPVDRLAISVTNHVAVGTHDGRIQVLDSEGVTSHRFSVSPYGVSGLCFSTRGDLLFGGKTNAGGHGWNLETNEVVVSFAGVPIEVSRDDRTLWVGGNSALEEYSLLPPTGFIPLAGHAAPVCRTAWSRDGRLLAALDSDGVIVIHDVERRARVRRFADGPGGYFAENTGIALSSDGQFLATATGGEMSVVRVRDVTTGDVLTEQQLPDGFERLIALGDNNFLLIRQERLPDRRLRTVMRDLSTAGLGPPRILKDPEPDELGYLFAEISPDGRWYAWYGPRVPEGNRRWELWDLTRGNQVWNEPSSTTGTASFSPDSKRVLFPAFRPWQLSLPDLRREEVAEAVTYCSPNSDWCIVNRVTRSEPLETVVTLPDDVALATIHQALPGAIATSCSVDPTGRRFAFGRVGDPLMLIEVDELRAAMRREFPEGFR
ncbi:MAG: serine/threonine-protein kinase [Planctomycetaceae bacterium]